MRTAVVAVGSCAASVRPGSMRTASFGPDRQPREGRDGEDGARGSRAVRFPRVSPSTGSCAKSGSRLTVASPVSSGSCPSESGSNLMTLTESVRIDGLREVDDERRRRDRSAGRSSSPSIVATGGATYVWHDERRDGDRRAGRSEEDERAHGSSEEEGRPALGQEAVHRVPVLVPQGRSPGKSTAPSRSNAKCSRYLHWMRPSSSVP